ncbi:hypothetical protein RB195_021359 [Necator americanus]|uniref:G-protein coupled receptors family 1 profile domain-containing protein n=1 Tax=Necator americanus TaxID=51031 RepID=A0ABR1EAL8_NECAM
MSQWSFSAVRVHLSAGGTTAITSARVGAGNHTPNVLALLLLPILCLVGLIGNAMVCIAIATDRRLHNVTNYFLFSLALADLLVCLLVMPLSIIVEVKHGVWTWNVSLCLLYVYADVFLCSASIVHMSAASQELANEHKATRVLAVVFICFFICWTPFFVANFIVGFCGALCTMPPWLGSVFLWLGYISSTVNPIIYTVFNKRFRQAFVRILRCQCCHTIRDPSSHYSRNYTTIAPDTFTCSNHDRDRQTSVNYRDDSTESMRQGSGRFRRQNSVMDESKKTSLPNLQTSRTMTPFPSVRDSRATTEEASDEDGTNEQRPLLPQPRITTMRKSLTTLLNTSTTSTFTKSTSMCAECRRDGMFHPSDTDDTMTSSTSSCPRHLTLFSSTFGSSLVHRFKCTKVENDIKTFVCAGCLEWSGSTIIKVIGTDFLSDPCKLKHHCKPVMRRKEKKEKKKKCRQEKKKRNLFEVLKEMVIKEPWRGERLRNGLLSAMKSHARLMSKSNEEKKKKLDEIVKLTTSVRLDTCYWKLLDTISSEDEKSGLTSEESYEEGVKLTSMEVLEFATNKAIDNINCTYVE